MERKFLQDNWSDLRSQISKWWDELTDDDLDMVNSDKEQLITILQDRYGYTEDMARAEVEERFASYSPEGIQMESRSSSSMGTESESSPSSGRGDEDQPERDRSSSGMPCASTRKEASSRGPQINLEVRQARALRRKHLNAPRERIALLKSSAVKNENRLRM